MKMSKELEKKLREETHLGIGEAHELDQLLAASRRVGEVVHEMPDEEPSWAWRSALNERILLLQRPPRRRHAPLWGLAGLGTACAVAASIFVLARREPSAQPVTPPVSTAEQIILDAHRANVFALSTGAGDGSEPVQATDTNTSYQWSEADLGAF